MNEAWIVSPGGGEGLAAEDVDGLPDRGHGVSRARAGRRTHVLKHVPPLGCSAGQYAHRAW